MIAAAAIEPAALPPSGRPGIAPQDRRRTQRKDHVLPILVVASLIVHLLILLPSLLPHQAAQPSGPREIPVEVVQEPAPKPPAQASLPPNTEKPTQRQPAPAAKPQQPQVKPASEKPQREKASHEKPADPPKPSSGGGEQRMKDLLGPMPAIALPSADANGTDPVSYEQLVLSKLAKAKSDDRFAGPPADATVSFHLDDVGLVTSVTLVQPSGQKFLDDEAVAMVHRGEPYPVPPPNGKRDYTVTVRAMPLFR